MSQRNNERFSLKLAQGEPKGEVKRSRSELPKTPKVHSHSSIPALKTPAIQRARLPSANAQRLPIMPQGNNERFSLKLA